MYEISCGVCKDKSTDKPSSIYVGESSRSAYERGNEHLDKLASLNSSSHMLRHMVDMHKGENFEQVKWGMFIVKFLRSAFERQIEEAVRIEKVADSGNILNSKSEYNNCTLPRLVTKIGDPEKEMKEFEKAAKIEKEKEEKMEREIRELRKERNRARLITEKNQRPKKRQKIDEDNYISIRSVWGHPNITAPGKNTKEDKYEVENIPKKKKRIEKEDRVQNLEEKETVVEGEVIEDDEIENIDWDKVLQEHKEKLEKESEEKEKIVEEKRIEEKSWELYNECKMFLEENEKNWEKSKIERETEKKKVER